RCDARHTAAQVLSGPNMVLRLAAKYPVSPPNLLPTGLLLCSLVRACSEDGAARRKEARSGNGVGGPDGRSAGDVCGSIVGDQACQPVVGERPWPGRRAGQRADRESRLT